MGDIYDRFENLQIRCIVELERIIEYVLRNMERLNVNNNVKYYTSEIDDIHNEVNPALELLSTIINTIKTIKTCKELNEKSDN